MTPGGPDLQRLVRPRCLRILRSSNCSGRRGCLLSTCWPVHPGPGFVFLGSSSIAKPSAGAGFGPFAPAFALALLSSPLLLHGMVLEFIFTATPMLAAWSLKKAFRRSKTPRISQLPSCPSFGSRDLPRSLLHLRTSLSWCLQGHRGVSCLPDAQIPACLEQQQMDAGLSLSGPCSCPISGSVTLRPKYFLKLLSQKQGRVRDNHQLQQENCPLITAAPTACVRTKAGKMQQSRGISINQA